MLINPSTQNQLEAQNNLTAAIQIVMNSLGETYDNQYAE
jgi:hypothetical protein